MSKKLNVNNLCGGELAKQVEAALSKVAENIAKYGDEAGHQIDVQIHFNKNNEFGFWEHDCRTTVGCKMKESQIGSKAPMKIEDGALFDNNPQQELPIK
jgi:hypothetical protein